MAAALLVLLTTAAAAGARLGDLARRDSGDTFTLIDDECTPAQCADHGAGRSAAAAGEDCVCACPQRAPLFREDRELCVDDLPECSLATFGSGVGVQKIPFVFLPLKGQIIHPSKEITFQGVKTPTCAVSGAQFLTRKGFVDLRNSLDADVPFKLFRDEGRTFLQWSGEDDLRMRMSGRVMVVRLLCRDISIATVTSPLDLRGVFTPCVAFRVQGTPPRQTSNVTEVLFALNAHTADVNATNGLSVTEYIAIGISSLLLGLIYVASVFLYLHIRKRRKISANEIEARKFKGLKKKDGSVITERDIIRINNERSQTMSPMDQEEGVVKNNPLLNMNRQYHDVKNTFSNDNNSSDTDDFHEDNIRNENDVMFNHQTTSVIIHSHQGELKSRNDNSESHRDESSIERLPDEHVSIVETMEDREIARPVGTTRRKLYFNPAYFEPHLMEDPPPAALEFLIKIREVIAVAKHKMAAKRFQPILNQIPEEETIPSNSGLLEMSQGVESQRSESVVSLKRENSRKKNCVGCPGCKIKNNNDIQNFVKHDIPACSNCLNLQGDKQNSIHQWLENIPIGKNQTEGLVNNLMSLPITENHSKLKKQSSFSISHSVYSTENIIKTKNPSTTLSVKSEPNIRNYNLPLPEFNKVKNKVNTYKYMGQTISPANDINPISLDDYRASSLRKYVTNKNALPDMVNEAIALEHYSKSYNQSSSDEENLNHQICNTETHSTYPRKSSESPTGKDYETDSLERTSNKKGTSTSEYNDAPSSQASPSLSNALPLEEELTMRNAVYKTHSSSNSNTPSPQREVFIEKNQYEIIEKHKLDIVKPVFKAQRTPNNNDYSLVTEVYVNNSYNFGSTPTSPSGSECSMGSRKLIKTVKHNAEKPGCLTIEVKDPPENYIKIHESDGFEPDTLDRKQSKHSELSDISTFSRKDLLKNIDNNNISPPNQRIKIRSSGTFIKTDNHNDDTTLFQSLKNEYEHQNVLSPTKLSPTFDGSNNLGDTTDDVWEDAADWATEEGRILTLELRHSKRQRQCTPPTIKQLKKLARPDVLPPLPPTNEVSIYEQPTCPPRRVEDDMTQKGSYQKNLNDRSLSPRTYKKKNISIETGKGRKDNEKNGPLSCSPMRASVQQTTDYETKGKLSLYRDVTKKSVESTRISERQIATASHTVRVYSYTYTKGHKDNKINTHSRPRFRRKKGSVKGDSGYLSSDSASSRRFSKKLVIAKIVSCSESDDTENEARSESGAESVETHSVYFGSFRKPQISAEME